MNELISRRELVLALMIAFMSVVIWSFAPAFLTIGNMKAVAIGAAVDMIIAVGMTVLLVAGAFDLSVGGVMALSGIVTGVCLVWELPFAVAILAGLANGALFGLINGIIVTKGGVNPLIATLGTMTVTRSLALIQTEGYPVVNLPAGFEFWGQGRLGPVPMPVLIAFATMLIGDFALRKTRILRQSYYVGGNPWAAFLSGMNVDRVKTGLFILVGFLSGVGGVLLTSRLMTAVPTVGEGIELRIIAACVIGGASLAGGEGTISGCFLGVLLMALVNNAMTLLGISVYWQGTVTGTILVAAVLFDMWTRRRSSKLS